MDSTSRRQKGRDNTLLTLGSDIQCLNYAKDSCGLLPVQNAFDSAGVLLTTIGVRSLLSRCCELQAHVHVGFYGRRTGLHGPWAVLR